MYNLENGHNLFDDEDRVGSNPVFNPQPKPTVWRNEPYRKFVRRKPCLFCRKPGPSEFHHVRWLELSGTGTKPSDIYGAPACKECHEKDQQNKNIEEFRHAGRVLKMLIKQLNEFLTSRGK